MKTIRARMTEIAFIAVVVVFVLMSLIITFSISVHNSIQADAITELISENGRTMPKYIHHSDNDSGDNKIIFPWGYNEESPFRTRYFLVMLDEDGRPCGADISHIASISADDAFSMAETALAMDDERGYVSEYRFRLTSDEESDYIIFLDCSENFRTRTVVLLITLGIFLGFAALITVIFGICSKYVLKPFEENSKRQRQFVTDASHELKTPLAIISANAEVLEYKAGDNKWTHTIINEVERMTGLIDQLLTLSKLEEADFTVNREPFDLSVTVEEAVAKFTEIAISRNVKLYVDIQDGIIFNGDREQIARLVSLLTENAAKYVTEGGDISVKLWSKGRKVSLSVFNTAEVDPDENYERLFDRFYRTDRSRSSQTGGHGIGLSIAKHICAVYNGDIKAYPKDDGLIFDIVLINSK